MTYVGRVGVSYGEKLTKLERLRLVAADEKCSSLEYTCAKAETLEFTSDPQHCSM